VCEVLAGCSTPPGEDAIRCHRMLAVTCPHGPSDLTALFYGEDVEPILIFYSWDFARSSVSS
jgi:hypothetical protein